MSLVVDASIVVKWAIAEVGSDQANELRHRPGLMAPSLIAAEIGSALLKRARSGEVSRDDALAAARAVLLPFDAFVPLETLHEQALTIAFAGDHPIYDCFYVALARREGAPLITADRKMAALAERAGVAVETIG